MNVVRLLIPLFLAATILVVPAVSQYSQDVFDLKKASDLYDERGFEKASVVNVDGRLMVTPSSGNVAYSYVLSDYQVNGHPVKVSLNYCGSVAFTAYKDYKTADRLTSAPYRGWSKFHQNRPAWILGVNGWAVNVISTTGGSFHCDSTSPVFLHPPAVYDRDLVFTVDGYDVMNRVRDFGAPGAHSPASDFVDQINILRADGSVLNLVHIRSDSTTVNPDDRPDLYSGYYVENGANPRGYAIVQFDPNWQAPSVRRWVRNYDHYWADSAGLNWNGTADSIYRVRRCLGDDCGEYPFIPRVVHYYSGDGEEAVFHEYQIPYGTGPLRDYEELSGGRWGGPTIFYLEQILTNTGPVQTFYRPRHYPYIWRGYDGFSEHSQEWMWEDSTRGRALITQFDGHRISFGYNSMVVEALGRTTTVRFDQITRNGNAASTEMMPWANLGTLTPASLAAANWGERNSQLYKSFVGYVTEIIDPMGRKTSFDYEQYTRTYRNYGFPYATTGIGNNVDVVLKNLRLKAVHEPTADYELVYFGESSELLQRGTDPFPYQTTNVVRNVKKKEKSGAPLTTDTYAFDWSGPQNALQWVTKNEIDNVTGLSRQTKTYYGYTELNILAPAQVAPRHTEVTRMEVTTPGFTSVTTTSYTNQHSLSDGTPVTSTYVILPSATTTTINGVPKSRQTFSYVIDTLRKFEPDTATILVDGQPRMKAVGLMPSGRNMAARFGMEVVRKISRTHDPSNFTALLRADTTVYTHIGLTDTAITWASRQWDKFASIQSYLHHLYVLHDSLTALYSWEQLMFWPPIGVYTTDTLTDEVLSPPIYGLESRTSTVDGAGTFLGGKLSSYRTRLTEGYGRQFLGSLLADSLVGRGGSLKLPIGVYTYADGLRFSTTGNLLSRVVNANGSASGLMYDPSFCAPMEGAPADTCFEAQTLRALTNDGVVKSRLHSPAGAAALYGKPMVRTSRVRFFDTSGHLSFRDLHTCTEYGFFGRPTATADANGWLSEFEYDRNARLLTAWMPGDFSRDTAITEMDTLDYSASMAEGLFGRTSYDRQVDTVVCYPSGGVLHKHIGNGPRLTSSREDTLLAMLPVDVEEAPRCPCEDHMTVGGARKSGDAGVALDIDHGPGGPFNWPPLDTCDSRQIFEHVAGYDGFVGHLSYHIGPQSGVGTAIRLDSASLEATITSILGQCIHLEVTIPQLNVSKTYVLNCPTSPTGASRAEPVDKDRPVLQSVTPSPYGYRLSIDLTSKIPQLLALGAGATLAIDLKVTTAGGAVAFASGFDGEDTRPRLLLKGRFRRIAPRTDYTLAYDHDDVGLTTTARAKVDDIRHTSNLYDLAHFPGESIRRSSSVHFFGADYRLLGTEVNTVLANGDVRVDEIASTLSGTGQVLSTTDPVGDVISTQYDGLGRPTRVTNADGSITKVAWYYGAPADFGITGQNFFGFCSAKV